MSARPDKPSSDPAPQQASGAVRLAVAIDVAAGAWVFEWQQEGVDAPLVRGALRANFAGSFLFRHSAFTFCFEPAGIGAAERCGLHASSISAMFRRVRAAAPEVTMIEVGVRADRTPGSSAPEGEWRRVLGVATAGGWKWLSRAVRHWGAHVERAAAGSAGAEASGIALRAFAQALLASGHAAPPAPPIRLDLAVHFEVAAPRAVLRWRDPRTRAEKAVGTISPTGFRRLAWNLDPDDGAPETTATLADDAAVRKQLNVWLARFPSDSAAVRVYWHKPGPEGGEPIVETEPPFAADDSPGDFVADEIVAMADAHAHRNSPLGRMEARLGAEERVAMHSYAERMRRKEEKRAAEEEKRRATIAALAEQRRLREEKHEAERAAAEARKKADEAKRADAASRPPRVRAPLPPVPVVRRMPPLALQDTTLPLADLRRFALAERAALWWVSNQSDDLLCLPHCRIERLEYQVRTALRVLGPLRGRALLSDEVGLGKTIEAGLVAKELFTRGMAKRMLVLTLPSLVDQWAEELGEKFGLATVTTNQTVARDAPERFWREHPAIVASLHTLKQPAHLAVARTVQWDLLVVDEAHYLRNRGSQAWQAVDALPRQFLLLLTATPVQNSLEELYNLVTLLQPGQLPSPKEFRARFLDPERPRQPREPEELRRLLGQVMIRNTRANAGIDLPPRRAETIVFDPEGEEAEFWRAWETELRASLAGLAPVQASLWGRLLLQAAGSSPAAWRAALEKFPDAAAARRWRERAPLERSWRKKCALLLPLTRGEHGATIFTQFLETQSALAEYLRAAGTPTFVINGATPAPQRQPLTEEFRRRGGALLLTHSGTEGRNLQFCRTLANFDLPWNPMEIEQRIGRLHRLGQRHPVHIFNFVQAGTLQEHLLHLLQEKLNLFELVVGETGLVLGERYSGGEFEEEILRRWRAGEGDVAGALAELGAELAGARTRHQEVKQLDATLFAQDYESA